MVLLFLLLVLLATPSLAQLSSDRLERLRIEARFYILDEDYLPALSKLEQARELAPKDRRVLVLMAQVLEVLGQPKRSALFYQRLKKHDRAAYSYLRFWLGYYYLKQKNYAKALEHFAAAEEVDPAAAIEAQAVVQMQRGKYQEALKVLDRLPRKTPQGLLLKAQAQFHQRDYDAAEKTVNQALALDPPARLARDLKNLLKVIKDYRWANRPLVGYLTFYYEYNDNVFQRPDFFDPVRLLPTNNKDHAILGKLNLDWRALRGRRTTWGLTGELFYKYQLKISQSTYSDFSAGTYLAHNGHNWGFHLPYRFYRYYSQSSRDKRVDVHQVNPVVYWQMSPRFRLDVLGLAERQEYFTSESDAYRWGLGATHYWLLNGWRHFIYFGYQADYQDADDGLNGFVYYRARLGGKFRIVGPLSFELGGSYGKVEYDQRPEPYLIGVPGVADPRIERKDDLWRAWVRLFLEPSKHLHFVLSYYYTNNNSNVETGFDPYNFEQNLVSLAVIIIF